MARLFQAGELTAIYVPDEEDEALRDLVRARDRAMIDQRKARQRLKAFLLRLGHRYLGKGNWSTAHSPYLADIKLSHAAQQIAFQEYLEAITVASERLERLANAMATALPGWKREPVVRALISLRGVALINAMTLVAEAGDLTRFESPSQLMSYFGLTPQRVFQRRETTTGRHHQGGQRSLPQGLGRGGSSLPHCPTGQSGDAAAPGGPIPRGTCHCRESAAALARPLSSALCPSEKDGGSGRGPGP